MAKQFRNDEQQKAFDEWWNDYMKQYFGEIATSLESNEKAMWVIGIAFQRGLEKMASVIQDALLLATSTTIHPTKKS